MKIRIATILTGLLLLIGACKYFKHNTDASTTVLNYPMMDSTDIFIPGKVNNFFPSADAIVYARKVYLNAIDLFVNKKDAKGSLPLFLQSLRIAPQAFPYFKYAQALYADGQYKVSREAYYQSARMDNSNTADAHLGAARCLSMLNDTADALWNLEMALKEYPFDQKTIKEDKAFEKFIDMERFNIILAKYSGSDDDRENLLFNLFAKNFPLASLPYSILPDSVSRHDGKMIDFRYADYIDGMADGQYSRSVQKEYQYMASLDLSPDFRTLIYRTVDYNGDTIYPVHYFVMTVDGNDSTIAQQEIACACTPLTIKTAMIDSDHVIEVKEIMQTWKEDPIYKGYAGNEVVKQEVKNTTYYKIWMDGQIEAREDAKRTDEPRAESETKP